MWRKRKASSSVPARYTDEPRRNRLRNNLIISSSEDEEEDETEDSENGDSGNDEEWDIKCILDESDSQYLIDWEGPWSPTWEPKENANDVAVKVWEDRKKQRRSRTRATSSPPLRAHSPSSQSSTPDTSVQSSEIEIENTEPVECEVQQPIQQDTHYPRTQQQDSPLFVPFDAVSLDEEDIPLVRSPKTRILRLGSSQRAPSSSRIVPSSIQQSRNIPVFEYVRKSPIPQEFILPGESKEATLNISQTTSTSEGASFVPGVDNEPRSDSPCVPETDQQPQRIKEVGVREKANLNRSPFPERTTSKPGKEVEIAETPPALLAAPQTQNTPPRALSRAQERDTGSQAPTQSINIQSNWSQTYSSSGTTSSETYSFYTTITAAHTRHATTIPESVDPRQTQGSTDTRSQAGNRCTLPTRDTRPGNSRINTTDGQSQSPRATPTGNVMDKYSHIEGATPREKMRNAYAQLQAKSSLFSQNLEPSETPSSAGDIDSSAPLSVPETAPLSVRNEKEPAHTAQPNIRPIPAASFEPSTQMEHPTVQTIQPSALTFSLAQDISPGSAHLGPSEFAIPLPMDSRVKDDYERVLADEAQVIKDFVRASESNGNIAANKRWNLVPKIQEVLQKLSNVSTHPDLNIAEHISESESDLQKEAAWAEYSSAKFLFLGYLVQLASDRDLHLVIMLQGGKTLQILERYLLGKGLTFTRPRQEMGAGTNVEVSMVKGSLSFGIQSTQSEGVIETYKRPSAIISLDRSFNAKSPSVEHMRTTYARDGSLLPVIRLLVSNTSEHIERCFHDVSGLQHLRLVVQYSVRLSDTVGDLQDNALGVSEDAEEVLSCLQSDNFHANWPLPAIEPLQIFGPEELDSAVSRNQSEANAESEPTFTQKRGYMEDTETPASKRQRVEPSQDISQLTVESMKFPSQTLGTGLQALERNLVQMKSAHAAELEKLRKTLAETQSRLQEREKAMEALQHRYEYRTRELHKVRQERDGLDQAKTSAEQRSERQKEDLTKVKDERTELRHELEKARESLKAGGGSMAELEKAQEEIRRLTKEQAGLERKADYEKNQAEYTREQYQNASKVAAQSGNENRQLRDENEKLKRKVEGDATRLREINKKNDESRHLSRVEELEAILSSREDLLRRKEEELREIRKNRPSTRSTSTPRSPKWAATSRPGSPGINNNNNGNGNGLSYGKGSALRFSSEMSL